MSTFQLVGLSPEPFEPFFALSDGDLAARRARRVFATGQPGFPCRISLEDAAAGDELLLLPYDHLRANSPYQASGPIYVRKGVKQAVLPAGEVTQYLTRRLISARAYDASHMMIDAEVIEGTAVGAQIERFFRDANVSYVHLHNARHGCFSCLAMRC